MCLLYTLHALLWINDAIDKSSLPNHPVLSSPKPYMDQYAIDNSTWHHPVGSCMSSQIVTSTASPAPLPLIENRVEADHPLSPTFKSEIRGKPSFHV